MKKWKKLLLMGMVIVTMTALSGCGRRDNTQDNNSNAADQDQNVGNNGTTDTNDMIPNDTAPNDGSSGNTENNNTNSEGGLIEDTGDAIQNGVNDVKDGMEDVLGGDNLQDNGSGNSGERKTD